jgi:hypothetical protein
VDRAEHGRGTDVGGGGEAIKLTGIRISTHIPQHRLDDV